MRIPALLLVGSLAIGGAQAQSGDPQSELRPMPRTLPMMLFAPDPLAGTMPRPLEGRESVAAVAEDDAVAILNEAVGDAELRREAVAQADPEPRNDAAAEATDEPELEQAAVPEASEPEPATTEPSAASTPEETAEPVATVRVIIENVESSSGIVNVAVCDTDFTPDGCPYHVAVPAAAGFVEAMFDDVPPGIYAVVGYHDINSNDEFDRFLGIPREPYAMSGEAGDSLTPAFRDATLKINKGENYVIIRMKRLGSG